MERRLIDASELEAEFAGPFVQTYKDCREALRNAPTISAVEVVRCRECKHRLNPIICPMCGETVPIGEVGWGVHEWTDVNGFCHKGERREHDNG